MSSTRIRYCGTCWVRACPVYSPWANACQGIGRRAFQLFSQHPSVAQSTPVTHCGAAGPRALAAAQYVYPYEEDDHRRLAEWYLDAGRPADAVRERRAVLALEPADRPRALYHLARALLAAGDRRLARGAVLSLPDVCPTGSEPCYARADLRGLRWLLHASRARAS